MKTKYPHPVFWTITILTGLAVCILPASWMMSAFGFPCRSLISDEGLRWLSLHLDSLIASPITAYALVYSSAAGALEICVRIYRQNHNNNILWTTLIVAIMFLSVPILAFILPDSPLRAITGGIWPSPLIYGLPVIIAVITLAVAMLYAYLSLYITSPGKFCFILLWGIRRHAIWIVMAMLLSFIYGTLQYIL
ncbi:MAG: hypothetical protein ACI4UA_00345 [Bacteroidaceae bacterium]